jgi:hypothetical protein
VKSAANTPTFRFGIRLAPTIPLRELIFVIANLMGGVS